MLNLAYGRRGLKLPARQGQVCAFIGRPSGALRLPQGLAEGLHERVFRPVQVAVLGLQLAVQIPDPGRPVDGHLFPHRQVQPHM